MPRPRKYDDDSERRRYQNRIRAHTRSVHAVEFRAIDGEGIGKGREHKYVLLGVADNQISNGGGLRYPAIFTHLYNDYLDHRKAAYAGFFLGYDFTQWLKSLPENRARILLTDSGRARRARRNSAPIGPFPVTCDGWEFDILGFKRFKLRPEGEKGWMYINDAGPFFQTSLLNVINPANWHEPVVTEEEYATLLEGKSKRDTASLDDAMRLYNRLENTVLARLMVRLNEGFTSAGIRLRKNQWFGPGQPAQAWLSDTKLPTASELSDMPGMPRHLDAGRMSYYGGWFEIFAHGHIPGVSYEYDINSAYPSVAANLPCLLHGRWTKGSGKPGDLGGNDIRIVQATVRGSDKHLGAMLHRAPDGSIRRPGATRGFYWQAEVDAAKRCGAIDSITDYGEWVEYEPCSCQPPLLGLRELYERRLQVGKNTSSGKSYKLIYNSVYGKLAQSIGDPKYGNSIYASLITSGCRRMILDAIATHPQGTANLLMVATDGVYFRNPHPSLALSEKIGDWSETQKENLTLFKPGVYWDDRARSALADGTNPSFKARGIDASQFARHIREIDAEFSGWPYRYPEERDPSRSREGWYPKVTYKSSFSMITCQQALQRGKWFLAGAVGSQELVQDSDPISKRHSGTFRDEVYWSEPFPDSSPFESMPYDRKFGQPDPEEYGITDDGTVLDTWRGLLLN